MSNSGRLACLGFVAVAACGPARTTFVRYPGASPTFDRAASDPKAVAIADQVIAAAGGEAQWNQVKQLRWTEQVANNGQVVIDLDEAWDRWNGRQYGRLHRDPQDVVVMRHLYDDDGGAYVGTKTLHKITGSDEATAMSEASKRWQFDTAALSMQFLLEEPGVKLAYSGETAGDAGKPPLDDIAVTFDPKDATRTTAYHVVVNRETHQIERIEIVAADHPDQGRVAYHLAQWQDVHGLKFPTVLENVGLKGEVISFKDIASSEPDETLYVPVVQ